MRYTGVMYFAVVIRNLLSGPQSIQDITNNIDKNIIQMIQFKKINENFLKDLKSN